MEQVEVAVFAAIFLISSALTRIFLRKKERFPPGPFPLPVIGHLHLHQTFHDLSKHYGPLMQLRLGSTTFVVVSSPELVKECLKTQDLVFSSRKQSTAIDIITYYSSFAFGPITSYWKFVKKLCTYELLGARNLLHFQPLRALEVNSFLQILMRKGKSGESFNLTEELVKLMSNVISHMMLSIRCSGTEGEGEAEAEAEVARTVIREVTQIFGEFDVADIIWLCKNFDLQGIKKRSLDIQRRYDALLENIITASEKQRRSGAASGEARDFLDIMESGNAEVTFTREHLKDLILDFFTAGTDTTAIVSEWAIAELINNPRVLKKAQEEIVKVIGFERVLQESDGPNLPYLQAVIKETFRLRPPIPMLARKSISDCIIDRYTVPANSLLFVNLWSMGRNPKIWDSPAEFLPEQFLEKANSAIDIKGQHFELLPFGRGWRGCPGMLLGIQEVVIIIGSMIQCFEWKLPDGSTTVDMTERPGLTAPRAEDLICRIDPSVVSVSV
ncbi:cytochrome P450 93B16-like [Salvia splendens]|uniref:cytochrome P450 93B16-like n=1 Tax=Salvia splendens TaxID=180675 RepID=UPI001C25254C|nr:cytochrome P450 93B16-like [Salvia splendens]